MTKKPLTSNERAIITILDDEEMVENFRKVVEQASAKGLCLTNLQKATNFFWDKYSFKASSKPKEIIFSAEEQIFFQKVDSFWEKFGKDISAYFSNESEFATYIKNYYTNDKFYKSFFKTMFIVLEKEPSVTSALIKKTEAKYFNTAYVSIDKTIINNLLHLFSSHFYFKTDENGTYYPLFFSKSWEAYQNGATHIYDHPSFKDFHDQHTTKYSIGKLSNLVIWFINTFL